MNATTYSFYLPVWAISYLVNADPSGLIDEDIQMVDEWVDGFKEAHPNLSFITYDIPEECEFYFAPAFGLACDCVEADVYVHLNTR